MLQYLKFSRKFIILFCLMCLSSEIFSQSAEADTNKLNLLREKIMNIEDMLKKIQNFKVSGYIQAQYQFGEQDASLKVGSKNENSEKPFHRIGIRRGRLKFAYDGKIASGVFQLDLTEKSVGIKDAYMLLKDPWFNSLSVLKAGVLDRPFGNEISYSSSLRESPERSLLFQTLFPEERDLGLMLQLQAAQTSQFNFFKLEAGIFAGNGIKQETDNRKDFIGHISFNKVFGNIKIGSGISYYHGFVYQGTENVYRMEDGIFVLDPNPYNKGKFAKREYLGFDFQFVASYILGMTQLRAEYLFGQQPGGKNDSKSPNSSSLPTTDTYIRKFSGAYTILIQDFGKLPISAVFKYDYYNPNKTSTASQNSTVGDVLYKTFGLGLLWRANNNFKVMAYYEIIKNEKSPNLQDFDKDKKDNVFTLRLQYKF